MSVAILLARVFSRSDVTLRYKTELRIAQSVHPHFLKLIEESPDGDAYRSALIEWHISERPVIAFLQGTESDLRVEGPWYRADGLSFPLGGLLQSPGVTAHLDPIDAVALAEHISSAVESVILKWIADHDLQSLPPVDPHINRAVEDPKALARIAQWLALNPKNASRRGGQFS